MLFRVTKEHIRKGKRGIRSCPIALCLKTILEPLGFTYISVGYSTISIFGPKRFNIKTDDKLIDFMERFDNAIIDNTRQVFEDRDESFEFELNLEI